MKTEIGAGGIDALLFDVFGTVVDWRSSIAREVRAFAAHMAIDLDAAAFADAWRGLYQPYMERVRSGAEPWTPLDDLSSCARYGNYWRRAN
jgi:2-haloacid dehalogenase